MAKVVDKNSDDYYNYIEIGKEIWYENPNAKNKNGEIQVKGVPYNKSIVLSKDVEKRIVILKDGNSCDFIKTLQVINNTDINVCDMAATKDINEVDLLLNLKNRLISNQNMPETFTNVGATLLIVNPFKDIPGVYGPQIIDQFINSHEINNPDQRRELSVAHLYDNVLISIRELLKPNSMNQALIISGESGAGKTEAAKNAMKCITYYFSTKFNKSKCKDNKDNLEEQILNCNPILEAFGNAKTIRNDNSSRFGKYVKIKFNARSFVIEGAMIKTYLLEKSRISELNITERNYHIFYMFLTGASDDELKKYHLLRDISAYSYLYKGRQQVMVVNTVNDDTLFKELINCFISTGFTSEDINSIFKLLAVILHLGNLKIIKKNDQEVEIVTQGDFKNIVDLLEVESMFLLNNFTKKPPSKHMLEWGSIYEDKVIKQFIDSLAKDLYNKLFLWIVAKLNDKLHKKTQQKQRYIGLLDIFGFECFQNNSLEQFCINFTNEKLQQLYIKDIFEADKEEFIKEGLEDKISLLDASFKDNKDIIRCMEAFFYLTKSDASDKRVFTTASNFAKEIEKSDKNRHEKMRDITENKIFTERINTDTFKLAHSAKSVLYTTKGWAEKNVDEIKDSMLDCMLSSKNDIIKMVFTTTTNKSRYLIEKTNIYEEREEGSLTKELKKYLGLKFQMDMEELKKSLEKCSHNYIRCIKPNEDKAPLIFWDNFVYNQIQYLGILGTIQVRKNGFPVRRTYRDFYEAFQLVHKKKKDITTVDVYMETTYQIINDLMGKSSDFSNRCLFGRTKVYMKQIFSAALEKSKEVRLKTKYDALAIIKVGYIKMRKMKKLQKKKQCTEEFQLVYRTQEKKIMLYNTKEQIKLIQSFFFAKKAQNHYKASVKNIIIAQNSFRILFAKRQMIKRNQLSNFLQIRLLVFTNQLRGKNRIKMTVVTKQILEMVKKNIVDMEYNNLWKKLSPFMVAVLARKKYKPIITHAKLKSTVFMKEYIISVFRFKLLTSKIQEKRRKTKLILNFGSTSMISNYYYNMIQKVAIIQKHLRLCQNRKEAIEKAFESCFKDEETEFVQVYNASNKILFPYKQNNYVTNIKNAVHSTYLTEANLISLNENQCDNFQLITPNKQGAITYANALSKRAVLPTKCYKMPKIKEEKKEPIGYIPTIDPYDAGKIHVFAKIAAIDIISSQQQCYETLWSKEFEDVYRLNMINNTPVQLIYAGNFHTFVLNSKGRAFSWGWNNKGQCGINPKKTYRMIVIPETRGGESNEKMQSLPVNSYAHTGMPISSEDIGYTNKVVVGEDFTMTLNTEANVMLFGDNSKGQLGQGHNFKTDKYQMLSNDFRKRVIDIFSTENFHGVLSKSNELYIWFMSTNDYSKLKIKQLFIAKKVDINQISCGKGFMIILSKNGIVYGCGSNSSGELGLPNDNVTRFSPIEIVSLSKYQDRIIQVRCGFKHVVTVSSGGNAYTWGNNSYGQLGNGRKTADSVVKITLKYNTVLEEKDKIIQVAAGFRASMFMTDKREIYYCGIVNTGNYSLVPMKFNLKDQLVELSNQNEYAPVRILATWNRSFSLFYLSIADIRRTLMITKSISRITPIVNTLAERWLSETIYAPYIPQIAQYFCPSFMKIIKDN